MARYMLIILSLMLLQSTATSQIHQVSKYRPNVRAKPRVDIVVPTVLELERVPRPHGAWVPPSGSRALDALKALGGGKKIPVYPPGSPRIDSLLPSEFGQDYVTKIGINDQEFRVIVDTGSSDTWLVTPDFQCVDIETHRNMTQAACSFGPFWDVPIDFRPVDDSNFNITYGDGEFLQGYYGTLNLTFASLNITQQQIAAVCEAGWVGDTISSGIVGLGYPAMISDFEGGHPERDSDDNKLRYDPIFTTMVKQNLTEPVFSVALSRGNGTTGMIAIGGIPDIQFTQPVVSTPITYLNYDGQNSTVHQFYLVDVGFRSNGAALPLTTSGSNDNTSQAIVDSGTTLVYIPTTASAAANGQFEPPAQKIPGSSIWAVQCNATIPRFAVVVEGHPFEVDPRDMILPDSTGVLGPGMCASGIADSGDSGSILGDVFFKNVLAIFDVGASEMRFAQREY